MPGKDETNGVSGAGRAGHVQDHRTEFSSISASLQNLFDSLSQQAEGATEREAKLLRELSLWKESYMSAEKKSTLLENQNKELRKLLEISKSKNSTGPPFAAVLIDGDGLIFSATLLAQGAEGGRLAAQSLREQVRKVLEAANRTEPQPQRTGFNVIVNVYLNKQGLGNTLVKHGLLNWPVFDKFVIYGFTSAHELNSVIDVGTGKEATDAKVREFLRLYADMPQCRLLLLGASHDNGYSTVLHSLSTDGRLGKVLILKGYTSLAQELQVFEERVVEIPGLFLPVKLPYIASKTTPVLFGTPGAETATPDKESPPDDIVLYSTGAQATRPVANHSKKNSSSAPAGAGPLRPPRRGDTASTVSSETRPDEPLTNKKVVEGSVSRLKPRPCHAYYLLKKKCASSCEWGHDYILNTEQLKELQNMVKRLPCPHWVKGKCAHGATCIYGHECPQGDECLFGSNCRFLKWHEERGDAYHP